MEFTSNPEVPWKFPRLPWKFHEPGSSSRLARGQSLSSQKDPLVLNFVWRVNSVREENVAMAVAKHYGKCSEVLVFLKKAGKGYRCQDTTAVAKYYGFERRRIFSTEGSFGLGSLTPSDDSQSRACRILANAGEEEKCHVEESGRRGGAHSLSLDAYASNPIATILSAMPQLKPSWKPSLFGSH